MRRYSLALLAASTMALAASQSAFAADMARPVYKAPPPPAPISDWSGIYVGLEGGYGWGHQDGTPTFPGTANATNCTGARDNFLYVFGVVPLSGSQVGNLETRDCSDFIPRDREFQYFNSQLADPAVTLGKIKQDGWLAGGFFGAQKQWGSWVLGLEGDIDAADLKGSVQGSNSTSHQYGTGGSIDFLKYSASISGNDPISKTNSVSMDSKIDMLASLRGKVGWSFAPDWLLYGTGGAAFAHVKNTVNQTASVQFCDENLLTVSGGTPVDGSYCVNLDRGGFARFISGNSSLNGTAGETMFGWSAGAGLDWKFWHDGGSAWVLGVEYLHYGFPNQTITLADNNGASYSFTAKENVDTVKARISYLFSIH